MRLLREVETRTRDQRRGPASPLAVHGVGASLRRSLVASLRRKPWTPVDARCRLVPLNAGENPLNYCDFMRPTCRIPYPPPSATTATYATRSGSGCAGSPVGACSVSSGGRGSSEPGSPGDSRLLSAAVPAEMAGGYPRFRGTPQTTWFSEVLRDPGWLDHPTERARRGAQKVIEQSTGWGSR